MALVPFPARYSDLQRAAVAAAWNGWGRAQVRPAHRLSALAAAGKLEHEGEPLEPFDVPPATVREIGSRARKRRAGEAPGALHAMPHAEAVDAIRRRLLGIIGHELERAEAQQARRQAAPVEGERVRQIARAAREVAALPASPAAPRPAAPGDVEPATGERTSSRTRGGLAAAAAAARSGGAPPMGHTHTHIGEGQPEPAPDALAPQPDGGSRQPAGTLT